MTAHIQEDGAMVNIARRLRASVGMDAIHGDSFERSICAKQMAEAADLIESLQRDRDALQARIDALMLEYCPDEMTPEQIQTWENNQKVSLQEAQPNER